MFSWWEREVGQPLWKTAWCFLERSNIEVSRAPESPLLSADPGEWKHVSTPMGCPQKHDATWVKTDTAEQVLCDAIPMKCPEQGTLQRWKVDYSTCLSLDIGIDTFLRCWDFSEIYCGKRLHISVYIWKTFDLYSSNRVYGRWIISQ